MMLECVGGVLGGIRGCVGSFVCHGRHLPASPLMPGVVLPLAFQEEKGAKRGASPTYRQFIPTTSTANRQQTGTPKRAVNVAACKSTSKTLNREASSHTTHPLSNNMCVGGPLLKAEDETPVLHTTAFD